MATKIRLQRHGRKSYAFYSIVIADVRAPRDGKFEAWKNNKQSGLAALKAKEEEAKKAEAKARLEAEKKINEVKAKALAEKKAAEEAAKAAAEAPAEEATEAPAEEAPAAEAAAE